MIDREVIITEQPWSNDRVNSLSPEDRKKYYRQLLMKILRDNANRGISISDLKSKLPYDERTIAKHFEYLVAIREAYKQRYGTFVFYYPNGRIMRDKSMENVQIGDKYYSFCLLENKLGNQIFIQEKKADNLNRKQVCGGLLLPLEASGEFLLNLSTYLERGLALKLWTLGAETGV